MAQKSMAKFLMMVKRREAGTASGMSKWQGWIMAGLPNSEFLSQRLHFPKKKKTPGE